MSSTDEGLHYPSTDVATWIPSMICANCGTENRAGRKFCAKCAAPLAAVCPSCGAFNEPGELYCGECATPLAGQADARPARAPAPAPAPAPVAERRLVTVLFADLVGFTTLAADRDPEETRELLTRYFDLGRDVIVRHGGTVEKFIGDAVMAVWGAPIAREDDAERAVRAALELVDAVRGLGPGIMARAGVLTGEAAVTIGATNQGMVAGDIVNTAARLQGVAVSGTVLVGEATQRATSGAIAYEPVGEQTLKGKAVPVPAWQAVRVVAEVGGRNRAEGLEAPFVGRDEELRLLKELFHATGRERRARLVSVIGPAGIGKSRLTWEFSKYLDGLAETVWWHQGRSPAYGEGISFWALGEMVRARCGLLETDDEATTRTRVAETLEQNVPDADERRWIEPALLALLGVGGGASSEQLFGAWRTFFERLSATATVALVFEDFHYADSGLIDFVDHLLEWSRPFPIFVMTLARPELVERRPDWGAAKRNFTSVYLEPLPEPAMRGLLVGLVPGLPESAVRAIVSRADGIPLYAVETVRMLLAEGRLREEGGSYVPVGDLSSLAVPETLTALIAARLDGLPSDDRALLSDAAVLGQSFTIAALAAVSGSTDADLEPRLRALARREILTLAVDARSPERGQYSFVQALIREVAYNTLAKRDRKARHLAAARFFEALGTDELAGALAGHYLAAFQNAASGAEAEALAVQARLALGAAADRAIALGAHDQAMAFLDAALSVASIPADQAALLERAASAALDAAQYSRAERYLRRAVDIHHELGEGSGALAVTALLARALTAEARPEEAVAIVDALPADALAAAGPAAAAVYAARAAAHMRLDQREPAIAFADRALEIAERHELVRVVVDAMMVKAMALNQLDRRFEASIVTDGVARFAEARNLIAGVLEARNIFAFAVWEDDPPLTFSTLKAMTDLASRAGDRRRWLSASSSAVWVAISMGEWDWALGQIREALTSDVEPGDRFRLLRTSARIAILRGEGGAELVELIGLGASLDRNATRWLDLVRAEAELIAGRPDESFRQMMDLGARAAAMIADACPGAARAALWAGDVAGLRSVLEVWDRAMTHGIWPEADRAIFRAALAALEGRRDDALGGFRQGLQAHRSLGMPFELARSLVDTAIALGSGAPEAEQAAREAREILTRLGARPFLARLDDAMSRPVARTTASASAVPPGRDRAARERPATGIAAT